ncbi:effector-associated constant component EACC1 [Streptomyces sp. AF1A]|jgi:hypothetical protein|uniref:effector-associated constant component EACC1 n=1 Tax=Streptomyces sp. AF1A TaxID=3394350 RepID=UPI0039BCB88A
MPELIFGFGEDEKDVAGSTQRLERWLKDTENLVRADISKVRRPPEAGRQGFIDEAVRVYAEVGPVLAAALTAYVRWLSDEVKSRKVSVKVTCPNGVEICAVAASQADVPKVRDRILRDCAG